MNSPHRKKKKKKEKEEEKKKKKNNNNNNNSSNNNINNKATTTTTNAELISKKIDLAIYCYLPSGRTHNFTTFLSDHEHFYTVYSSSFLVFVCPAPFLLAPASSCNVSGIFI